MNFSITTSMVMYISNTPLNQIVWNRLTTEWMRLKIRSWGNGVIWESKKILSHDLMTSIKDIDPDGGALQIIPGSHKANYAVPKGENIDHLKIKMPMKAGSDLLFTHDLHHGSLNEGNQVRRTAIFTYCPGVIANSFGGDALYDRLFEEAPEGSWQAAAGS